MALHRLPGFQGKPPRVQHVWSELLLKLRLDSTSPPTSRSIPVRRPSRVWLSRDHDHSPPNCSAGESRRWSVSIRASTETIEGTISLFGGDARRSPQCSLRPLGNLRP